MSSATRTRTTLALPPLEPLFETPELGEFDLPAGLAEVYGGPLGFSEPRLYANFVASLDGVVALPGEIQSNRMISAHSESDRFVVGLLRACADAVLVGAGTMLGSPQTLWTAEHAYPPAAALYGELRRSRRRPPRPTLAVLSGNGSVDPRHPALEQGALLLTSERGAARLRGRIPRATTILAVGAEAPIDPVAAVEVLRQRGHELILSEGGPTVFGALIAAELVEELFLTTSPLLAGRSSGSSRPALVDHAELLPMTTVEARLLTLRRAGSHLFARYRLGYHRRQPRGNRHHPLHSPLEMGERNDPADPSRPPRGDGKLEREKEWAMGEFVKVASVSEVGEGELAGFSVGGERIAVANVSGTPHAFDDTCTHLGCSLAEGELEGTVVTCPCHGSQFDVTSGEVRRGPAQEPVRSYAVRVESDAIQVEL